MFSLSKNKRFLGVALVLAVSLSICSCSGSDSSSPSNQARVLYAVDKVRVNLAAQLGNEVPSLNLIIQTVNETIFVSASIT